MDSLVKTFSRKTKSEPIIKTAKKLKTNDDKRSKKSKLAKTSSSVEPISATKAISETNMRESKSREYNDNYEEIRQKIQTKEFYMGLDRCEISSEKSENEMQKEDNSFSTTEQSLPNIIPLEVSGYQSNDLTNSIPTEDCSEDEQWEIIRVPYSTTKWLPNDPSAQTVVNTIVNETDNDSLGTKTFTSNSKKQQDTSGFKTDNLEKKLSSSGGFDLSVSETLEDHRMESELADNSISSGERPNEQNHQNMDCFTMKDIKDSSFFHEQQEEIEIIEQQSSSSLQVNFDDNMDLEGIENDLNISEILLDEIETQSSTTEENDVSCLEFKRNNTKFLQCDTSAPKVTSETENNNNQSVTHFESSNFDNMDLKELDNDANTSEVLLNEVDSQSSTTEEYDARDFEFKGNNRNFLPLDKPSPQVTSEIECSYNQYRTHYEECLHRIKINNSSHSRSNLKICNHHDPNRNLLLIKTNRSKLNNSNIKYSVISSKSSVRSNRNEQKELRTFVMNTLKETHPELHMKDDVALRLQVFLVDMLNRIGDEANNLVLLSSKKVLDKRALTYAIKLSLEKLKNEADVASGKRNQWLF